MDSINSNSNVNGHVSVFNSFIFDADNHFFIVTGRSSEEHTIERRPIRSISNEFISILAQEYKAKTGQISNLENFRVSYSRSRVLAIVDFNGRAFTADEVETFDENLSKKLESGTQNQPPKSPQKRFKFPRVFI